MRIVAGEYSSRKLETLKGDATRPTLDKVREAVFSSLGGFFAGGAVLDLYAGSGAIGLEALSRGMDQAVFVDSSREAVRVIRNNIASLKAGERSRVLCTKAVSALGILQGEGRKFDLVYLDPPYARQENDRILRLLEEYQLLNPGARVVIESLKEDPQPEDTASIRFHKDAVYGITRIRYYICQED